MLVKKNWLGTVALILIMLLIRIFSANHFWVENYYSTGIYIPMAKFFRLITGWLPFSIGDILYGAAACRLVWKTIKLARMLVNKKLTKQVLLTKGFNTLTGLLLIYIAFNILWGINYNRQGIAQQLGLQVEKYSSEELKKVNALLLQKVNTSKQLSLQEDISRLSTKDIFGQAKAAYTLAQLKYPFLDYTSPSVKSSLWGWLGNYIGFTGYYNPFTGEAQINTTVPVFLQPYTTCHEMAHQLGYAKENEANFVGYLSASSSKNSHFLYSCYLDLFIYADRNLYSVDSASATLLASQLLPSVKADIKALREFNLRHANPVEPVIRWLYGKYLQGNQQPSGVLSYDEVTGFLIAYYKKYGTI